MADSAAVVEEDSLDLPFKTLEMKVGPSHPATHGTVRIQLELDGETVHACRVEVGYLHRGFEKECESGLYYQAFPYTDRLNYVSPMINNVGYALACEKLFDIESPERCQYLRVIASEASGIADHLTCLGACSLELGAFSAFLYAVEARESVWDLLIDDPEDLKKKSDYLILIQARLYGQSGSEADKAERFGLTVNQIHNLVNGRIKEYTLTVTPIFLAIAIN